MNDDELEEALRPWGGVQGKLRLIARRENAVYEAVLADGTRCALRLHRVGYRSPAAIAAELDWMARLSDAGFACPHPIPTQDGGYLSLGPGGRRVSVVSWVTGEPLAGSEPTPEMFRRLGALLAQLHEISDISAPDTRPFPRWSAETWLGETPAWGAFWRNPALLPEEAALLQRARDAARRRLEALGDTDSGLIHADVLAENVLEAGGRLWLIDFDDSGVGPRGYDLGTAMVSLAGSRDYPDLAAALVAGYAARRGSSAADHLAQLPLFTALRAMASCGWVLSRTTEADPRRAAYAERAVRLAERWLEQEDVRA